MDRAIDLIARLVARGIDARFDLWGPNQGPRATLEKQAESLGSRDRIAFHGPISRSDLGTIASEGSFLLQLSRLEGMAMVVVEAMQLGLVPVVTPVGEIRRYCRDGENALLVDPGDLDGAADRIADLLSDPDRYRSMSAAARNAMGEQPPLCRRRLRSRVGIGWRRCMNHRLYLRQVGVLFSATAVAQLINFVSYPLLSRTYDSIAFGYFAIFVSAASIIGPLACGRFDIVVQAAPHAQRYRRAEAGDTDQRYGRRC